MRVVPFLSLAVPVVLALPGCRSPQTVEFAHASHVLWDDQGREWLVVRPGGGGADFLLVAPPPPPPHDPHGMHAMPYPEGPMALPHPPEAWPEHWREAHPPVMLGVILEPGGEVAARRGADPDRSSHLPDLAEHHPGGRHGLQDDDVLVAVNGQPDASPAAIRRILRSMRPGDPIAFTVRRGDGSMMETLEVTVMAEPFDLDRMVREHPGMFAGPGNGGPDFHLEMLERLDRLEMMVSRLLRTPPADR